VLPEPHHVAHLLRVVPQDVIDLHFQLNSVQFHSIQVTGLLA
jgi:hypothetical protein